MVRLVGSRVIEPHWCRRPDLLPFAPVGVPRPAVFVGEEVFRELAQAAHEAYPKEAIGILLGRVWRDAEGYWVVVRHFVPGLHEETETSHVHCRLTPEGSRSLRERVALAFPTEERVGWAHSHPMALASFSGQDLEEQGSAGDHAVGLLAYRWGDQWRFSLYWGREAVPLVPFVSPLVVTAGACRPIPQAEDGSRPLAESGPTEATEGEPSTGPGIAQGNRAPGAAPPHQSVPTRIWAVLRVSLKRLLRRSF